MADGGLRGREQFGEGALTARAVCGGLADGLRALGQKAALLGPGAATGELPGGDDARRALGGQIDGRAHGAAARFRFVRGAGAQRRTRRRRAPAGPV
ncbi:hypothetical protein GCM10009716_48560 [Streptomyces sodiiphilus]|uniref:Uncharacterized protein n=1 Tax=Streptomyces sodiiphilus TaxID=226217 RepID=A0ABN2PW65_9ACTN